MVAPKKPSTYSNLWSALEEEAKVDIEALADKEAAGAAEFE